MLCSTEATARVWPIIIIVTPASSNASISTRIPYSVRARISGMFFNSLFIASVTISPHTSQYGSSFMILPIIQSHLAMYLPSTSPTMRALLRKGLSGVMPSSVMA